MKYFLQLKMTGSLFIVVYEMIPEYTWLVFHPIIHNQGRLATAQLEKNDKTQLTSPLLRPGKDGPEAAMVLEGTWGILEMKPNSSLSQ